MPFQTLLFYQRFPVCHLHFPLFSQNLWSLHSLRNEIFPFPPPFFSPFRPAVHCPLAQRQRFRLHWKTERQAAPIREISGFCIPKAHISAKSRLFEYSGSTPPNRTAGVPGSGPACLPLRSPDTDGFFMVCSEFQRTGRHFHSLRASPVQFS